MLGPKHSHAPRVKALLEAAGVALRDGASSFAEAPIALNVLVRCQRNHLRSDATNYLGGIADVLEEKTHRSGQLDHLQELAEIALYANDRQIEEVSYRWEDAASPSYVVTLRELGD